MKKSIIIATMLIGSLILTSCSENDDYLQRQQETNLYQIKIDNTIIANKCIELGGNNFREKQTMYKKFDGTYISTLDDDFDVNFCFYKGEYIRNINKLDKLIFEKSLIPNFEENGK